MFKNTTIVSLVVLLLISCSTGSFHSIGGGQLYSFNSVKSHSVQVATESHKNYIITVRSQDRFNRLNSLITEAINNNERSIVVKLHPGIYFYTGSHISRSNEKKDISISIEGNGAILIARGNDYKDGDDCPQGLSPYTTLVDINNLITYTCWDTLRFSDRLIEVVDEAKKLCRIHDNDMKDFSSIECIGVYIHITASYQSFRYKVEYIKDGWVYFIANNLTKSNSTGKDSYNVNNDYNYAHLNPRFMLCNIPRENGVVGIVNGKVMTNIRNVHECKVANFMFLENVEYRSVTISGIHFIGNSNDPSLLKFTNTNCGVINITDCMFESLYSGIISSTTSNHIVFSGNKVSGCYTTALYFRNGCEDIRITNNVFEYGGQCVSFSFFVQCEAKDFYIANNIFRNFGYGAIATGMMRGAEKRYECSGIIEDNEVYMTDYYFNNKEKYTSMDAGAIQVRTQSDKIIIRYNYIHDYVGMKDNRGIFCDEGARNFKIYNNVILNTPNCYSIDARQVSDRTAADTLNNRNNLMMYNIVDNRIRFVGRDMKNNGCVKCCNILLKKQGSLSVKHQYAQLEQNDDDLAIDCKSINREGVEMEDDAWSKLKKIPGFSYMKKYLK